VSTAPMKRSVRVAEGIRAELGQLLLRGLLKDPRASGVVVTGVRLTDDLRYARVFVRLLEADPSERRQKELVQALSRASGLLRREVGARLRLKHAPELRFEWDDVADSARRIEHVLDEIRAEAHDAASSGPGPEEAGGGEEP